MLQDQRAQDQIHVSKLHSRQVKNPGTLQTTGKRAGMITQIGSTLNPTLLDGLVTSMIHGLGLITHPGRTGLGQMILVVTLLKRLVAF